MKTIFAAIALSLAMVGASAAATVTNKDDQTHILIITEGSTKVEVIVDAGASATVCPAGCFVTMPSGDRETLSGEETIEIINGSAVIR